MKWVIGIDIGGTNLVVGAVAHDGSRVIGDITQPTNASRGANAVIGDVVTMARSAIADVRRADPAAEIVGAGAGAPGPLDTRKGVVFLTPNLGWVNVPLRQRIRDGLGIPVAIENDANCAVLAECWIGAARQGKYVIGLTLGTGIGGGIVIGGKLYHGASDAAGEFGHMTIQLNGRLCGCGNHGCIEAYASARAIARRAIERIEAGEVSELTAMAKGDLNSVTSRMVYEAAAHGDQLAQDVADRTAEYLGAAIANLLNIFNPDIVVILGGVSHAGEALLEPLRREVASRAFKPAVDACRIVAGELQGLAGVYGAARSFMDQHEAGLT